MTVDGSNYLVVRLTVETDQALERKIVSDYALLR